MSVHLGMHISQMAAKMGLKKKSVIWTMRIVFAVIGAVGIYAFMQLKFADYMFGKVQFAFIDTSASAVLTALQYLTVMVLFAYAGYVLQFLIKSRIQRMPARDAATASYTERSVYPGKKHIAATGADRSGTTLTDCSKSQNKR